MASLHSLRSRRGANAIEFALLMPVLVVMLGGLLDYGWYFWREALLINGLRESVRAGGMQLPTTAETGSSCAACISAAKSAAATELENQNYASSVTVTPTIQRIPSTGTPCTYAVVIEQSFAH